MQGDDAPERNEAPASAQEASLSDRLHRLDSALAKAQRTEGPVGRDRGASRASASQGMAQAVRLASEFVAGVVVGGAIGWGLDRLLGISPWGLILFVLIGFAAGVLNMLRAAGLATQPGKDQDDRPDGPGRK